MHRETVLTPSDLIWPLFVTDGSGVEEPVASLPGVSRWSVDHIAKRGKEAVDLGIPCIALFPNTQPDRRSDDGAEALNPDNLMCRAIKAVRDACGNDIGIAQLDMLCSQRHGAQAGAANLIDRPCGGFDW